MAELFSNARVTCHAAASLPKRFLKRAISKAWYAYSATTPIWLTNQTISNLCSLGLTIEVVT
jgi:hypothetical protein